MSIPVAPYHWPAFAVVSIPDLGHSNRYVVVLILIFNLFSMTDDVNNFINSLAIICLLW